MSNVRSTADSDYFLGPDSTPLVLPLRGAGKEYHRALSHLPQAAPLQSAPRARLMISWWEREVQIWQLPKPFKEALKGSTEPDPVNNHKKLGRILVKGESNITSATISEDGTLLVVSTASDVKAFKLDLPQSPGDSFKVSKANVLATSRGATKVQISPDKNCICWIEEGSKVMVAQIVTVESAAGPSYTIQRPSPLRRLRRDISKYTLLGGLGTYDRSISHVAFSADSKMLAVTDLAGYIDTWILRGPGSKQQNGKGGEDDDDAISSASSEDSSDDEQAGEQGPQWIRNPRASLMPRLSAQPVCLSFSSQTPGSVARNGGPQADDYTLLAITTSRELFTFNPLRGALSDWSRRNPYVRIPEKFRATRDLVKGALWQGSRVWIYGVSYLCMLDLSVDLTPEMVSSMKEGEKRQGTKRKRNGTDSGAGGKMEKHSRVPQNVRMVLDAEKKQWVEVDMAEADDQQSGSGLDDDEDDDDDDEDMGGSELQLMRDQQEANGKGAEKREERTPWWQTYKYRSILGIVPLGTADVEHEGVGPDEPPPLEVALVERPIWEVDLPPRYFGEGELER